MPDQTHQQSHSQQDSQSHLQRNFTYEQLSAAIERIHKHWLELHDEDAVKDSVRFQYQALLEAEEKFFGLVDHAHLEHDAEKENSVKKERKKREMSPEAREKMSRLMKERQASLRAKKANGHDSSEETSAGYA